MDFCRDNNNDNTGNQKVRCGVAQTTLLNTQTHKNLRVKTERSAALGDAVMWSPTFAAEFRSVQTYYPILFQKDTSTHELFPVALFGFEQGENLFLCESGWDAGYVPLMIQRVPFSIGLYPNEAEGEEKKRMVHIDLEHPRVSENEGERLFGDQGEESPFLERVSGVLETIHVWNAHNKGFMAALTKNELIEPVTMDVTSRTGEKGQLVGFYTINEDRLADLTPEAVTDLHRKGYLEPIYMAIASLSNMRKLAERK
jgi:hypothetical protein